jgi:galactokinase
VECATLFALDQLFALGLTRAEMVHLAQRAEHEFAGVKCGVMDMFASLFGKKGHVVKLDCRSLFYEYVPLDLKGYKILLLNTNVRHKLSSSEYNTRREQCEQGVEWVREQYPEVKALRDVTPEMLEQIVLPRDGVIHQRCRYVVEENRRLTDACSDLKNGDLMALGQKMYETHEGLRKLYEVSCRELDFLVDHMRQEEAVIGARMMGGGFGGCTINLIRENDIQRILSQVEDAYRAATGVELTSYVVAIEDGTGPCPATADNQGMTAPREHVVRQASAR